MAEMNETPKEHLALRFGTTTIVRQNADDGHGQAGVLVVLESDEICMQAGMNTTDAYLFAKNILEAAEEAMELNKIEKPLGNA